MRRCRSSRPRSSLKNRPAEASCERHCKKVKLRKLYISAFGSGLGHATRMLPVARMAMEMDWEVTFSSSGEVVDHLRAKGFRCNRLPYVDVVYNKSGSFTAKET